MSTSRRLRNDGYFGLHTDFHASSADCDLWGELTESMAERVLDALAPDYVQVDCKGHFGYASYPTKVGYPAPGLQKDGLATWRWWFITRTCGTRLPSNIIPSGRLFIPMVRGIRW